MQDVRANVIDLGKLPRKSPFEQGELREIFNRLNEIPHLALLFLRGDFCFNSMTLQKNSTFTQTIRTRYDI